MDVEFEETYTEYEEIDDLSVLEDTDDIPQVEEPLQEGAFPQPLYQLKLEYSQETFYATTTELNLQSGDYVITPTRYGDDMAHVMGLVHHPIRVAIKDIVTVTRKATDEDFQRQKENLKKEKEASALFKEKVLIHKLDMKLVDCHYLLEDPKVIFFFTADSRIDFRKLVKDLVAILRLRIELRQIGVRDESRIAGGIGWGGRPGAPGESRCHGDCTLRWPHSGRRGHCSGRSGGRNGSGRPAQRHRRALDRHRRQGCLARSARPWSEP